MQEARVFRVERTVSLEEPQRYTQILLRGNESQRLPGFHNPIQCTNCSTSPIQEFYKHSVCPLGEIKVNLWNVCNETIFPHAQFQSLSPMNGLVWTTDTQNYLWFWMCALQIRSMPPSMALFTVGLTSDVRSCVLNGNWCHYHFSFDYQAPHT